MPTLDQFKDFVDLALRVLGLLAVVLVPLLRPWVRGIIHSAVKTAPALTTLAGRVAAVETWQHDHDDDVKLVPRLADLLERMEATLTDLNTTLRERVARLEGTGR